MQRIKIRGADHKNINKYGKWLIVFIIPIKTQATDVTSAHWDCGHIISDARLEMSSENH